MGTSPYLGSGSRSVEGGAGGTDRKLHSQPSRAGMRVRKYDDMIYSMRSADPSERRSASSLEFPPELVSSRVIESCS